MKPNNHGIPGAAGSLARRFALGALITLLVADGLASGAQAYTTQMWNTTALFNGGTKTSTSTMTDTCENVTANALQLNNTGNYQGIGLTTGTSTCATGAWGVNPSGLKASWDFQHLSISNYLDFSGNNYNLIPSGSPSLIVSRYGTGINISLSAQTLTSAKFLSFNGSSSLSAFFLIKVTNCLSTTTSYRILMANSDSSNAQGTLRLVCPSNGKLPGTIQILFNTTTTGFVQSSLAYPFANWTYYWIGYVWNGLTVTAYVNGSVVSGTPYAQVGSLVSRSVNTLIANAQTGTVPGRGILDEVLIFTRALSSSEVTALITDGRSSFLSSGSWTSSNVAFTTAPAFVTLTGTSFTSANRPSRLRFLSSSGTVVFDTLVPSSLASPIQIPVNLTFNLAQWSMRLDMIGNGVATAKMTSILVTLGAAPLFQTSDIIFIFGILLLVFALFFLLPEGGEFGLISLVCAMGFVLWSFLFFYAQSGNVAYSVITIGLGVMVGFLSLGKIISETAG